MERLLSVVFGPSRSKRFAKAVALARAGPGECVEIEPGRYQVRFRLDTDADSYGGLGRLLERVRHWRATEVYENDEQVSVFHTREMAWCASFQLNTFGECREHFQYGILPRCGVCPLFDSERAIRAGMPEEQAPEDWIASDTDALVGDGGFAIVLDPEVLALLGRELPDWLDLTRLFPNNPPPEWSKPEAGSPPG